MSHTHTHIYIFSKCSSENITLKAFTAKISSGVDCVQQVLQQSFMHQI